jgi:invasion protein IalB
MTFRRSFFVGLAALLSIGSASAQTPPAKPPAAPAAPPVAPAGPPAAPPPATAPVAGDPAQTTATYGDWVLRCVRTGDGATATRVCEVVQTMVLQGQQQPVAQVAVGYDKADLRLTLLVPPAVSFSKVPTVSAQGGAAPKVDLAWRRCLPNGCFADVVVNADLLKTLRSRTDPLQIAFKDANERDATLPFSLRGLSASLDALAKEPR